MIIDSIDNAARYFSLHPLFQQAFQYIRENDLEAMEEQQAEIGEGLKAIVSRNQGKTKEESLQKFECHNAHIDIQYLVAGSETMGWKHRSQCRELKEKYNSEKDVSFYSDAPQSWLQLVPGQFAIFFPEDVHAPMIGDDEIKKLIIKVKI